MRRTLLFSLILQLGSRTAAGQVPALEFGADTYRIAFSGVCQRTFGICLVHSDGSQPRLLRGGGTSLLFPGSWSPDGRKIVAIRQGGVRSALKKDLNQPESGDKPA